MKYAKTIWFILLVIAGKCSFNAAYAQVACGTSAPSRLQESEYQQWILRLKQAKTNKAASSLQYIPIRFHVLRRDDGTGGPDITTINQGLVLLNQLYKQAGISFYMCGSAPNYINSSLWFDMDTSEEDDLVAANYVGNAINVYLLNSITNGGAAVGGYAYFPDPSAITNRVFSLGSRITNNYTLAHELGHYFNLYHTFENNNNTFDPSRKELVIRPGDPQNGRTYAPNCSTAGDYVCDTPADPYGLSGATTSGCTYTGSARDANNDLFAPDMTNIMSYYTLCVNKFSAGQYTRMGDGLLLRTDPGNEYTLDCMTPNLAAPANLAVTMTAQGALIQFTFTGNNAAGFIIERATSATGEFTPLAGLPPTSLSYVDATLAPYTTYYYRVKASNASTQYSATQQVTSTLFYCAPTYSQPVANFVPEISDFIIQGTTLSKINSGNPNPSRYSDFSQTQYNANAGQTYTFIARAVTGGFGTYVNQHATIWLDKNRDGVLASSEILFQSSASQLMNPSLTGTITIPSDMTPGPARLRIRSQYSADGIVTDPCNTLRFGEAEDYTLNIQGTPSCFTANSSVTNISCFGATTGQVTLSATGATGTLSYTLNGSVNSTGVFTGLAAGQYTGTIKDATTGCSVVRSVTITQPTQIVASLSGSTAVCGAQTVNLAANVTGGVPPYRITVNGNQTVNYVSGTAIPVTPGQTTIYTLSSVQDANSCIVNPNATATVTVNTPAPASISPSGPQLCAGQTLILSSSPGVSYAWNTGGNSQAIVINATGTYSVTVTDGNSCRSVATTTLSQAPAVAASITGNTTVCNGTNATLTANGGVSYLWSTGANTQAINVGTASVYSVTATNAAGCRGTATVTVSQCSNLPTFSFKAKFLLEGFLNAQTGLLSTDLATNNILPKQQPFNTSPWNYTGTEQVSTYPANVSDWVLIVARTNDGTVIDRRAGMVRNDGTLINLDGSEGISFTNLPATVYFSIHHKSHLAVMTNNPVTSGVVVDFTTAATMARGNQQEKLIGTKYVFYVGDYDANGVINNLDFNLWKGNGATVGQYLAVDADCNGVVNNLDYNRWTINRSKVATSEVQQ